MAVSEGATVRSDDPVLQSALSEMTAEGYDFDAPLGDLPSEPVVSQPAGEPSGTAPAAPAPAGDVGSAPPAPPVGPPAEDPLEGTEPFAYGKGKTLEGIYRVPGQGALIPEDRIPAIQQFAERMDSLTDVVQQYAATNAAYERLSEWTTTGADGKEQTMTGQAGLAAQRMESAQVKVERDIYEALVSDPQKLFALLMYDEQGTLIHNPEKLQLLRLEAELARGRAEADVKQTFMSRVSPPAAAPSAPDYSSHAPSLIAQALAQLGLVAGAIAPDDQALLTAQLKQGLHLRGVTERDRQQNPALRLGSPIVDESWTAAIKHLAGIRASQAAAIKTTETAAKFNTAQDRGRSQGKKTTPPPSAKAPDEPPKKLSRTELWDAPLKKFMEEEGIPR